jgi:hypothetical protein
LLVALRKTLVYGGPNVVNRDYEGEIQQAGDTVRITSISRPTINTYVPNVTAVVPEELTDSQRVLVIDQQKYWAFQVDDVDQAQAKGPVIPQAMSEGGYGLADVIDQFLASLYTGTQSANVVGSTGSPIAVTAAAPNAAYDNVLVPLRTRLGRANVPMQGRYAIVSPEIMGRLLIDSRFIKVNESGTSEALRNGLIGRAAGFDIYESNNVPNPTGNVHVVQAGRNTAISYAEQLTKTLAYRPEAKFADAVKGLAVYGAKLIRPDSIAIAYADALSA